MGDEKIWKNAFALLLERPRLAFIHSDEENPFTFESKAFNIQGFISDEITNTPSIRYTLNTNTIDLYEFITGKLFLPSDSILEVSVKVSSFKNILGVSQDRISVYIKKASEKSIHFYDPSSITKLKKMDPNLKESVVIRNYPIDPKKTVDNFINDITNNASQFSRRNLYQFFVHTWQGTDSLKNFSLTNQVKEGVLKTPTITLINSSIGSKRDRDDSDDEKEPKTPKMDVIPPKDKMDVIVPIPEVGQKEIIVPVVDKSKPYPEVIDLGPSEFVKVVPEVVIPKEVPKVIAKEIPKEPPEPKKDDPKKDDGKKDDEKPIRKTRTQKKDW